MPRVKKHGSEALSSLPQGPARPLSEINSNPSIEIEPITGGLVMESVQYTKFMNEEVMIYLHPSREQGALEVVTPSVDGVNQPIIRGKQVPVKRKYLEALRRAYTINYEQRVQDPSRPENIQMIARAVPDYPFDVIDDSAKGKAWLKLIDEQVQQEASRG